MTQDKMNCHYVTESLTKPWCMPSTNNVRYYDFETDSVKTSSITELFAEENTNSREIEQLISKFIESPIGKFKKNLIGKYNSGGVKKDIKSTDDWSVFRALHLYCIAQSNRFLKTLDNTKFPNQLDNIFLKGEQFLDQIALQHDKKYKLMWVQLPSNFVLCFPEIGFFHFPVFDSGCISRFSYGHGFPISPFVAIVFLEKSADEDAFLQNRHELAAYSVGRSALSQRVLIPHNAVTDQKIIADEMKRLREWVNQMFSLIDEKGRLVREMYGDVGIDITSKSSAD